MGWILEPGTSFPMIGCSMLQFPSPQSTWHLRLIILPISHMVPTPSSLAWRTEPRLSVSRSPWIPHTPGVGSIATTLRRQILPPDPPCSHNSHLNLQPAPCSCSSHLNCHPALDPNKQELSLSLDQPCPCITSVSHMLDSALSSSSQTRHGTG